MKRYVALLLCCFSCKRACGSNATKEIAAGALAPFCHDGWCWENPLPTGDSIVAVAAVGPSEAWMAVDTIGGTTLFHVVPSGMTTSEVKRQITAFAHADKELWAATREGYVLHFDGATFVEVDPKNTKNTAPLASIWASSEKDVWAVGADGVILHYDGAAWTHAKSPTNAALFGVRGRNASDIWASGDGVILHYDGAAWTVAREVDEGPRKRTSPAPAGFCGTPAALTAAFNETLTKMRSILPLGAKDVWFAGGSGRMLHWDGAWNEVEIAGTVQAMWSSEDDAWSVGDKVRHLDGATWNDVEGPDGNFFGVDGSGPRDAWAVGIGQLLHFNGKWSSIGSGRRDRFTGMWVGKEAWAVGEDALMLHRTSKGQWESVSVPVKPNTRFNAIGGAVDDDLWAFPQWGKPLHWDGKAWTVFPSIDVPAFDVRAPASDDVWAIASLSLSHWDGKVWTVFPRGDLSIEDLWAPTKGVAWATARPIDTAAQPRKDGSPQYDYGKLVLAQWNGTKFVRVIDIPDSSAKAIGGVGSDVWVSGDTVQHWDGKTWLQSKPDPDAGPPPSGGIGGHGTLRVNSNSDIYVGVSGGLEHFDGHGWTTVDIASGVSVAFGASGMYAWTRMGGILHHP